MSEGRGTTRPFELIGAPYIDADDYADALNKLGLEGVYFRACVFQPTFQKHGRLAVGVPASRYRSAEVRTGQCRTGNGENGV
jgi:uncharacterized protein YbbC (DUF1343 family)